MDSSTQMPLVDWHFFVLPLELRTIVYDFVMRGDGIIDIAVVVPTLLCSSDRAMRYFRGTSGTATQSTSQLLSTCKAIHAEALPILYGNRTFLGVRASEFTTFFRQIDPAVVSITLEDSNHAGGECSGTWPTLPSLRRVTLSFSDYFFKSLHSVLIDGTKLIKCIIQSQSRAGNVLYDYINLTPGADVEWLLELNGDLRNRRWVLRCDAQLSNNARFKLEKIERKGKEVFVFRLEGLDGGPIVPLVKHLLDLNCTVPDGELAKVKEPAWKPCEAIDL